MTTMRVNSSTDTARCDAATTTGAEPIVVVGVTGRAVVGAALGAVEGAVVLGVGVDAGGGVGAGAEDPAGADAAPLPVVVTILRP